MPRRGARPAVTVLATLVLSTSLASCTGGDGYGSALERDDLRDPGPHAAVDARLDALRRAPGVLSAEVDELGGTPDDGYLAAATVRVETWLGLETEAVVRSVASATDELEELDVDLRTVVATETVLVEIFGGSPLPPSDLLAIAVDAETDPDTAGLYTETLEYAPDPDQGEVVVLHVSAVSGGHAERFRTHWHEVVSSYGTPRVVLEL